MGRKRTALCLLAALMVVGSAARPSALAADQTEDDTVISVTLSETGVFALSLSVESSPISRPTSATSPAETVSFVQVRTRMTDTKSYRNDFDLWFSATPFTSTVQVPLEPAGTFYQFPADALAIHDTRHPRPGRCDHAVTVGVNDCSGTPQASVGTPFPIGNLWALDQAGNIVAPANPTGGQSAAVWTVNNTLDEPRRVMHADAGAGTLTSDQGLRMRVTIPGGMPAGAYKSTITVTTVPPGP